MELGKIGSDFGRGRCNFTGNFDRALLNQIEQYRTGMKHRRVEVEADLSDGEPLFDVIEDFANLFAYLDGMRPTCSQFKEGSIGRDRLSIARPLIDAIDTVHDDRSGINLNTNQIVRQRITVEKFKVSFFPNEQVVNDLQRPRTQDFHDVRFTDEASR